MGMTMAEKILAQSAGRKPLKAGVIVEVEPDLVLTHDHQGPMTIREFRNFKGAKLWDPERLVVVMDHRTPTQSTRAAENHQMLRRFAKEQGVQHVFGVGQGVCHDVLAEKRLAKPGQIIVGTDSHTLTIGALGAFGTGVGSSEMAAIWLRGKLWLKVPESIKVVLQGELPPCVNAKDVNLEMLRILGTDGATYKSIEFHGSGLAFLNTDQRMTLCNMCLEMGAKSALVPVDDVTKAFFDDVGQTDIEPLAPDSDAVYERELTIDLRRLEPLVAAPSSPQNVITAREVQQQDVTIDQALIGTCTNGRITDIREAATVMNGRKVHPNVRFLVVPATPKIMEQALDEGHIQTFVKAGAMVGVPCCGPCGGYGMGAMAADEVCVTSGSRNFVGRLGSPKAKIYLGSPATAAASAIAGKMVDPRSLGKEG